MIHFRCSDDQGPAATNVPDRVYGVIDLYGQAAQATIIDLSCAGHLVSSLVGGMARSLGDFRFVCIRCHVRNTGIRKMCVTCILKSGPYLFSPANLFLDGEGINLKEGEFVE